jgi:hypothetical protein
VDAYRIYGGTDENWIVGTVAPGLFAQEGRVLAHDLREPGRPWETLHGSGGVGEAVEVPGRLGESVVVRAAHW